MHIALKPLPSPLMGEGSGWGGARAPSPPSHPSPAKGGRGIDLPLSAFARGEGVFTSPVSSPSERGRGEGQAEPGRVLAALDCQMLICKPL
jgi:hypothetical protein